MSLLDFFLTFSWFWWFFALDFVSCQPTDEFWWGTATASYQIEGATKRDGRLPCIWDTFCTSPPYKCYQNETGEPADDDYDKYEEDIQLMLNMGLKYYRLSFAWPRILPDGININMDGIKHYQTVINLLLSNNITPLVTLYHWDLPQNVYDITEGGWINSSIIPYYVKYASTVFEYFNNTVKNWITFNEPWTFCTQGYLEGSHAPGRCTGTLEQCPSGGNSSTEPYLCTHNVLLSHSQTVDYFRSNHLNVEGGKIGITLNVDWAEPASNAIEDYNASQRKLIWQCSWYADPIWFGDYPDIMKEYIGDRLPTFTEEEKNLLVGSWDYFYLNHYTTNWVSNAPVYNGSNPNWNTDQQNNVSPINQYNGTLIGVQADSSWLYVVPYGIYNMLEWVSKRYNAPPIYVTENGVDVPNESSLPLQQALNDTFRINFYSQYISNVLQAKKDGINVKGYFAWSLMDNFEWADGYNKRFGMHYVDYTSNDLTRYPKESSKWYANFTKYNP